MKIRTGFVSNSSSSSFIINTDDIPSIIAQEYNEQEAIEFAKKECKWLHPSRSEIKNKYSKEWKERLDTYENRLESEKIAYKKALEMVKKDVKNAFKIYPDDILEYYRYKDYNGNIHFCKYNMSIIVDVKKLIPIRFFYMIKDKLDDPIKRLQFLIDFEYLILNNNSKYLKWYNKNLKNRSSRYIYESEIKRKLVQQFAGNIWRGYLTGDEPTTPDYINKYIKKFEKAIYSIFSTEYRKLEKKLKNGSYIELLYEDNTPEGQIAEQGIFFECAKDTWMINHH